MDGSCGESYGSCKVAGRRIHFASDPATGWPFLGKGLERAGRDVLTPGARVMPTAGGCEALPSCSKLRSVGWARRVCLWYWYVCR